MSENDASVLRVLGLTPAEAADASRGRSQRAERNERASRLLAFRLIAAQLHPHHCHPPLAVSMPRV
jgi:hypothetical protein